MPLDSVEYWRVAAQDTIDTLAQSCTGQQRQHPEWRLRPHLVVRSQPKDGTGQQSTCLLCMTTMRLCQCVNSSSVLDSAGRMQFAHSKLQLPSRLDSAVSIDVCGRTDMWELQAPSPKIWDSYGLPAGSGEGRKTGLAASIWRHSTNGSNRQTLTCGSVASERLPPVGLATERLQRGCLHHANTLIDASWR